MSFRMANVTATRSVNPIMSSSPLYRDGYTMNLELDHETDTMYCGSRFQSSNHAIQQSRHGKKPVRTIRMTTTRTEAQSHDNTIQNHTSSAASKLPPSTHYQTSPQQQHTDSSNNPTSLYKANTSKPRAYLPPPVTEIYQLDRFLDELTDFGSLSLAEESADVNGNGRRQRGETKRERELRKNMSLLVRRIEV